MKVCILTQPLHNNYGGLLQAYALQKFIREQGHNVLTADIPFKKPSFLEILRPIPSLFVRKYIIRQKVSHVLPLSDKGTKDKNINTDEFIQEYISRTAKVSSVKNINDLKRYNFDAFIVGSDQVWRPRYSPGILTYFLNFLPEECSSKRIAYAASFGTDHTDEYTSNEIKQIKTLSSKFDFIGVREDSGVTLCKKVFKAEAEHVLDPTLLLHKEDYYKLVDIKKPSCSDGNLFSYILDADLKKETLIERVSHIKGLKPFGIVLGHDGVKPSVEAWIKGFIQAEFIITDSFHGVAFSLLFNKPFIAIGNEGRGLARFTSILNKFNLLNRLVLSVDEVNDDLINKDVDYNKVNKILEEERAKAANIFEEILK